MDSDLKKSMQRAANEIVDDIRGSFSGGRNAWGDWATWADPTDPGYVEGTTGVTTIVGPSDGGGGDGYDAGGIIPGPIGAARRTTVHGGELVANPEQQARLLDAIMTGRGAGGVGGGSATILVQLNGRTIAEEAVIPLQELSRSGRFTIQAK